MSLHFIQAHTVWADLKVADLKVAMKVCESNKQALHFTVGRFSLSPWVTIETLSLSLSLIELFSLKNKTVFLLLHAVSWPRIRLPACPPQTHPSWTQNTGKILLQMHLCCETGWLLFSTANPLSHFLRLVVTQRTLLQSDHVFHRPLPNWGGCSGTVFHLKCWMLASSNVGVKLATIVTTVLKKLSKHLCCQSKQGYNHCSPFVTCFHLTWW